MGQKIREDLVKCDGLNEMRATMALIIPINRETSLSAQ